METTFYIRFTLKTVRGFESFGQFFISNDRNFANQVFKKLKGNDAVNESNILQMDFIETKNNLPVNIKMIRCTLNEMVENCRIITRELFKHFNLQEM